MKKSVNSNEGINEQNGTILKPVGKKELPIDMFYFNEYAESYGKNATYLENADFKDFIIDGELATTIDGSYTSGGKGFMINLYKNCDWNNIIVKNTDGTGFGMDNPINSTITNCIAIGCGKTATSKNVGASGFGIGFGFSEEESIIIKNCKAYGNRKFGFFFEHQGRFTNKYTAKKAKGFIVEDCIASGNLYNFGGERANDVTFKNCKSYETPESNPLGITNASAIYFGSNSRRTTLENMEINQKFSDVTDPTKEYYIPVYWALNNGITEGGTINSTFNPENNCTTSQAITLIWRMAGRPGEVLLNGETLDIGFKDVATNAWYSDAIKWGKDKGILPTTSSTFDIYANCSRAEFITMLWKYSGKPTVTIKNSFSDIEPDKYYEEAINWAASKGIIKNTNGKFNPNSTYTRGEVITILYRLANNINVNGSVNEINSNNSSTNNQNNSNITNENTNNSNENENTNNSNKKDDSTTNDTLLKELYLSKGSLKFEKDIFSYNVTVPYDVDKLEIIGTPINDNSKVEGIGEENLKVGENNFTVKVTAENGEIGYYEILIIRQEESNVVLDNNNKLKELSIEGYKLSFQPNKYNYELTLNNNSKLNITAISDSSKADVTIIGNENLMPGSEIKIIVSAENGDTKIYKLKIVDGNNVDLPINYPVVGLIILTIIIILIIIKKRKKPIV